MQNKARSRRLGTPIEKEIALVAAARFKAEEERKKQRDPADTRTLQADFAKRLGVSEVVMSRLLAEARERGILSLVFHDSAVNPEVLDVVETRYFNKTGFREIISDQYVRVIELPGTRESEFCDAVADFLSREIPLRSARVGLMSGRTIDLIYQHAKNRIEADPKSNLRFVPLVGDPLHAIHLGATRYSASLLAEEFEDVFVGRDLIKGEPSLAGIPAYVSSGIREGKPELPDSIRRFIQETPGYRRIFLGTETEPALIKEVDTIITSMGIIYPDNEERTGTFLRELKLQERKSFAELAEIIFCDLGGVLIPRDNLAESDAVTFKLLDAGWTGIRKEHFERVRRNAALRGSLGVVVVAFDEAKLEGLKELRKLHLPNVLLISENLGEAWRSSDSEVGHPQR